MSSDSYPTTRQFVPTALHHPVIALFMATVETVTNVNTQIIRILNINAMSVFLAHTS